MSMWPRPKTIDQLIREELKEAERGLLEALSGMEYAQAIVAYQQQRVNRLREQLRSRKEN